MGPAGPMDPENWPKLTEEMEPGNQTGTSKEEDLQTGLEHLNIWTGAVKKTVVSRVVTWVKTGSTDHISIKFRSAPGSVPVKIFQPFSVRSFG